MTEAQLTHAIIDVLRGLPNVRVWRQNTGRRGNVALGLPGSADITGFIIPGGRRIEIEVKLEKGKLSNKQVAFLVECEMGGVLCGTVRSIAEALDLVTPAVFGQPARRT